MVSLNHDFSWVTIVEANMSSNVALGLDLLSIEHVIPAKLPLLQAQVTIGSREYYLKKMDSVNSFL